MKNVFIALSSLMISASAVVAPVSVRDDSTSNCAFTYENSQDRSAASVVLFVVLDGVRWQDLAQRLPQLVTFRTLSERGIAWTDEHSNFTMSGPNYVSMPGYAELLTGSVHHGCVDNACTGLARATLFHETARTNRLSAAFSSWPSIGRLFTDLKDTNVVGSFGKHLTIGFSTMLQSPAVANAYIAGTLDSGPGHEGYRSDRATARLVDSYLRTQLPDLLFVSLGDTDEYAHAGNRSGYDRALDFADHAVGEWLEACRARAKDVLVVLTTDHGRAHNFIDHGANYPESRFTWAIAAHSKYPLRKRRPGGRVQRLTASIRDALQLQPLQDSTDVLVQSN
jgi:Metalloenzyme superfamily